MQPVQHAEKTFYDIHHVFVSFLVCIESVLLMAQILTVKIMSFTTYAEAFFIISNALRCEITEYAVCLWGECVQLFILSGMLCLFVFKDVHVKIH